MREMFFDDPEPFDDILTVLRELELRIDALPAHANGAAEEAI